MGCLEPDVKRRSAGHKPRVDPQEQCQSHVFQHSGCHIHVAPAQTVQVVMSVQRMMIDILSAREARRQRLAQPVYADTFDTIEISDDSDGCVDLISDL